MQYKEVLSYFNVKKQMTEGSAQCICPAHRDDHASLTISEDNGRILVHCHAGCNTTDILNAVGLKMQDLFEDAQTQQQQGRPEPWITYLESREGAKVERAYHFKDLQGRYVFSRIRLGGKRFILGKLVNGQFTYGLDGLDRKKTACYYGSSVEDISSAVDKGIPVYYCEGEKDVDSMIRNGFIAVTCGSSADWHPGIGELFKGADVVVLEDNDVAGRRSSEIIAKDLQEYARIITVFTPTPDIEHGDVSDYFERSKAEWLWDAVKGSGRITFIDLNQFHTFKDDSVSGVYDYKIFRFVKNHVPLFVMGGIPYIYKDGSYRPDLSGAKLKTIVRKCIYPVVMKYAVLKRIYDLILSDAELQVQSGNLNQYPAEWICFMNGFYDPVNKKLLPHNPRYMAMNQIPFSYDPDCHPEGPVIAEWLEYMLEQPEDREMLLQYVGYCMTRDTRQQKFLILNGNGGTGKSTLIKLIEEMIGSSNISNVSLLQLSKRFSVFNLLGKILNCCADLENKALDDTSILKKALGEDSLMAEAKGKDMVPFKSYAKLLFSTNELPAVKGEKTNAFYRRLLILSINKAPKKVDAFFYEKIQAEMDFFIHLCVEALGRMYVDGTIVESPNSIEAVQKLREESDTVSAFLKNCVIFSPEGRAKPKDTFKLYETYCTQEGKTPLKKSEFFRSMEMKGIYKVKSNGTDFYKGIVLPKDLT